MNSRSPFTASHCHSWVAVALVCLWITLVSGCGFHLRGAVELPPSFDKTYIDAAGVDRKMVRSLSQSLRASGVQVVSDREEAGAGLALRQQYARRPLSMDDNADVREFELVYQVYFQVRSATGETLLREQQVQLYRDYTYDKNDILGKSEEEENIREDMMRDAVQQVMRRLETSLGQAG